MPVVATQQGCLSYQISTSAYRAVQLQLLGPIQVNLLKSMCHLDPLLLLSVYQTGSSTYYIMHGAGCRALNVLLIHSYVTVRISFGYICTMCL